MISLESEIMSNSYTHVRVLRYCCIKVLAANFFREELRYQPLCAQNQLRY
jgi:hypothetical protein